MIPSVMSEQGGLEDGRCGVQGAYLPELRKIVLAGGKMKLPTGEPYGTGDVVSVYGVDNDAWSSYNASIHSRWLGGAIAMPDGESLAIFGGFDGDVELKHHNSVMDVDVLAMHESKLLV